MQFSEYFMHKNARIKGAFQCLFIHSPTRFGMEKINDFFFRRDSVFLKVLN